MKKLLLALIFSFLISLPVILPFFHGGYFPTHDGEWAVVRLGDMFRTLRDFQIPARYSGELNFGYGYPLFNFAYPLPYYLGMIIYVFGAGFVGSIKILFAASVCLSAFFMFLASKNLWKNNWAGIISAVLYIYFPYRMVDLYVRGSIGESISFALFPLLLYLLIKLTDKISYLLIGGISISVAALITTHNIMIVLFLPLYVMFAVIQAIIGNKKIIKPFLLSIVLGFGLSAFFWIPAILEKGNILLSKIPIADRNLYFLTFKQLIVPGWGYGIPTGSNSFSYQLGLIHFILFITVVLSLLLILIKDKHFKDNFGKVALSLTSITLLYAFLLFEPSNFLWKSLPFLSEINYPWIILGILGLSISLLAGYLCRNAVGRYVLIILGIIAIVIVYPYARPEKYIDKPDSYYLTNDATTTSSNELMPLWVKEIPLRRATQKVEVVIGSAKIENLSFNSKKINFSVNSLTDAKIKINTIYYPGWKITIDENDAAISYNNNQGVIEISVPSGNHVVNGSFGETPMRLVADMISLISLVVLAFFTFVKNKYEFS
jgi:hypothetical protein